MKLAMIMGHSAGSAGLALGLLLGEVAYDRQLEPLALAGFEDRHNPQNEEPNADHKLEEWKQEENDPDTRYQGNDHRQHGEHNPQGNPDHGEADGLEGVKAHQGDLFVGVDDEEDDGRNDGDVGESRGGVGREAGRQI